MKEIFQYLSHISYHNDDMGEKEKTFVLHTNFDRVLILGKQADAYTSIQKALEWFGLGIANKRQVYCLDLGFDLNEPNTYIPLRRGEHWDDVSDKMLSKAILDITDDQPSNFHSSIFTIKHALDLLPENNL